MIVIRGILGADPHQLITDLMAIIAERTGLSISCGQSDKTLCTGQWRQLTDEANQCTGSIRIVLASEAEVKCLSSRVNATAVEINGRTQHIEVHNSLLVPPIQEPAHVEPSGGMPGLSASPTQAGNGRGSLGIQAGQLPGPPGLI